MTAPPALRALLAEAIDYAGLFPPAALPMAAAVAEYAAARTGEDAWALGRFVVPAARLDELAAAVGSTWARSSAPWKIAATLSADAMGELDRLVEFARRAPGDRARLDTVEFKVSDVAGLRDALDRIPAEFQRYAELALDADPAPFVAVLGERGAFAKFRTGGVTADLVPAPDDLLRALDTVVGAGLGFKCTAGLHHPVRGRYRLTYTPDGPTAVMYGYLNVFLATAALALGQGRPVARRILLEHDPAAFIPRGADFAWRHLVFPHASLLVLRERGMRAFGSCSFREPVDELAAVVA